MVNNNICLNCKKNVVCEWYKTTISKKFDEDSKTSYDMTITIDRCGQVETIEE